MCFIGYCFFLQGMSSKLTELEEELAKANNDLEQEKATTLAQIEEIEALKKVSSKVQLDVKFLILRGAKTSGPRFSNIGLHCPAHTCKSLSSR